ncbi:barstar family protein [Acidovorax sacchari]|uniref:barstar family protein n=1 Tax=Acidovorax sacchari TaxID=3230736 RepID=UPI0039E60CCB
MPNVLTINIQGKHSKADVLAAMGEALQLGGPGGNHPVRPGEESGWGMNWDALFDCLLNLHSGGIWGTSPVIEFPLELVITGAGLFARDNPDAFAVLNDVLEQTRETYARSGRVFEFVIRE